MWIVCLADNSHEMASLIYSEKIIIKIRIPSATILVTGGALMINPFQPADQNRYLCKQMRFLFVLRFYGPVNPMVSCRARSLYLTTRLLGRLSPLSGLTSIVHILSPETDYCPSWISGRERMTVENISWSISTKECCRPRQGLNPRPPGPQSDGASNWATKAGNRWDGLSGSTLFAILLLTFEWFHFLQQWMCLNSEIVESMSETQGWMH